MSPPANSVSAKDIMRMMLLKPSLGGKSSNEKEDVVNGNDNENDSLGGYKMPPRNPKAKKTSNNTNGDSHLLPIADGTLQEQEEVGCRGEVQM